MVAVLELHHGFVVHVLMMEGSWGTTNVLVIP